MSTPGAGDGPATQVSAMPLPPMQYVSLFKDENIQRGRAPSPPKPIQDSYNMFGVTFHSDDMIIRPLESQGIRRLYPQSYDHKRELKKLNHSLFVNFLDMLDILIRCPDTAKREEKKEDLNLLFVHMHHLINEFRPHQARETLRVMLELQKRQRFETAERLHKHLDKVREILQNTLQSVPTEHKLGGSNKGGNLSGAMDCTEGAVTGGPSLPPSPHHVPTTECAPLDRIMCDIIDAMAFNSGSPI